MQEACFFCGKKEESAVKLRKALLKDSPGKWDFGGVVAAGEVPYDYRMWSGDKKVMPRCCQVL